MNASGVTRLYTPEVLALATSLSAWPFDPALPWQATARSPSCGSVLVLSLGTDGDGRIERIGMRAQACAIGQASAAIFARSAAGLMRKEIQRALDDLINWLSGRGARPEWPGIGLLEPAIAFPGRHGAIILAWKAAIDALPSADMRS